MAHVLGEYDEFMNVMESDTNSLTGKYTQEQTDLKTYNADYADVMAWRDQRNKREEAEQAEEERKKRKEKLRYDSPTPIRAILTPIHAIRTLIHAILTLIKSVRYDSATRIQKAYQDYKDRVAAAKKGKKKKKK